jgi:hypothetical protein
MAYGCRVEFLSGRILIQELGFPDAPHAKASNLRVCGGRYRRISKLAFHASVHTTTETTTAFPYRSSTYTPASSIAAAPRMAIDHSIHDPEANRKVLLDHLFLISAGEIHQRRSRMAGRAARRSATPADHIHDREEFLDQSAGICLI